jgi:alkanesulfonate monooxygenase SsuD/methylene tetrahydromethanopterin reductase-like flavin-dependent oxidoreductase (luciferase family)
MLLSYAGGFKEAVKEVAELEKAGLDLVWVPEAYSFDAPSAMGYLAANTERVTIASGILPIYSRTPSLLAMTAAGIDYLSDGRCMLGLGASGPQVIEGFHGLPYEAPVSRIREIIEICRKVWRRERLQHDGRYYQIPLPQNKGTGLGKPLKLINHPVREDIPIAIAALGAKSVETTAELADAWLPASARAWKICGTCRAPRRLSTSAAWARDRRISTTTSSAARGTPRKPSRSRTCTFRETRKRPKPPSPTATWRTTPSSGPRGSFATVCTLSPSLA